MNWLQSIADWMLSPPVKEKHMRPSFLHTSFHIGDKWEVTAEDFIFDKLIVRITNDAAQGFNEMVLILPIECARDLEAALGRALSSYPYFVP